MRLTELNAVAKAIEDEMRRAVALHGDFRSEHEALAVILEEYYELQEEVFKKQVNYDHDAMRKEALHLAAMAAKLVMYIDSKPTKIINTGSRIISGGDACDGTF